MIHRFVGRTRAAEPSHPPTRPSLDPSLPLSPSRSGLLAAETVLRAGGRAVLDIVTPGDVSVLGWCCFARDRASNGWFATEARPIEDGRHRVPVPGAGVRVWGFERFEGSSREENVWRVHAENVAPTGGRDVCLRLVVASAASTQAFAFPRIRRSLRTQGRTVELRRPWDPAPSPFWKRVPAMQAG